MAEFSLIGAESLTFDQTFKLRTKTSLISRSYTHKLCNTRNKFDFWLKTYSGQSRLKVWLLIKKCQLRLEISLISSNYA